MTDFDTFRWGDAQTIFAVKATGETTFVNSSQMLNARWQRPCVWRLMIAYNPQVQQSALTFTVSTLLKVGIGQAIEDILLANVAVATPFAPTTLFFDIPAETIIVQFSLFNVGGAVPVNDGIRVVAMAAPHAEPGAVVQMRDALGAQAGGILPPDQRELSERGISPWMPPGFEDGELRYRHGRR